MRTPGKRVSGNPLRGFESHSLRARCFLLRSSPIRSRPRAVNHRPQNQAARISCTIHVEREGRFASRRRFESHSLRGSLVPSRSGGTRIRHRESAGGLALRPHLEASSSQAAPSRPRYARAPSPTAWWRRRFAGEYPRAMHLDPAVFDPSLADPETVALNGQLERLSTRPPESHRGRHRATARGPPQRAGVVRADRPVAQRVRPNHPRTRRIPEAPDLHTR